MVGTGISNYNKGWPKNFEEADLRVELAEDQLFRLHAESDKADKDFQEKKKTQLDIQRQFLKSLGEYKKAQDKKTACSKDTFPFY